jgi:hypothetical protein
VELLLLWRVPPQQTGRPTPRVSEVFFILLVVCVVPYGPTHTTRSVLASGLKGFFQNVS